MSKYFEAVVQSASFNAQERMGHESAFEFAKKVCQPLAITVGVGSLK